MLTEFENGRVKPEITHMRQAVESLLSVTFNGYSAEIYEKLSHTVAMDLCTVFVEMRNAKYDSKAFSSTPHDTSSDRIISYKMFPFVLYISCYASGVAFLLRLLPSLSEASVKLLTGFSCSDSLSSKMTEHFWGVTNRACDDVMNVEWRPDTQIIVFKSVKTENCDDKGTQIFVVVSFASSSVIITYLGIYFNLYACYVLVYCTTSIHVL
uniref:Uncharacterized protein n=1 Tax=Glossina austeni TaxID=7395 RepID=A0A1A9VUS5_GLOAU